MNLHASFGNLLDNYCQYLVSPYFFPKQDFCNIYLIWIRCFHLKANLLIVWVTNQICVVYNYVKTAIGPLFRFKFYDKWKQMHNNSWLAFVLCSGYLAPEYALGGQLTMKADVYSFGVLILEIISGRSSAKANWGGMEKFLLEWVCWFFLSYLQ